MVRVRVMVISGCDITCNMSAGMSNNKKCLRSSNLGVRGIYFYVQTGALCDYKIHATGRY